jgi:hypothetical protein
MPTGRPKEYLFETEFDLPKEFVFRWCTDYSSQDGKLGGEGYDRRVLKRTKKEVVYEDLWWEKDGWRWRHTHVTLRPSRGWHADSTGNTRHGLIDYRLTALPGQRTRLNIRMRRTPTRLYPKQPSKAAFHKDLATMWRHFGKSMEREYRAKRRR